MLAPSPKPQPANPLHTLLWLPVLTALAFLVQGFHPLAEDGGLYAAGIEWLLHPALFPHDTAFVREHLRFSLFAPLLATIVRHTHIPLLTLLLLADWISIALTLLAGRALLRRCGFSPAAQLGGITLLAAWATIPIAGTSLFLLDPYVTARSFSTPLSLFALAFALDDWRRPQQPPTPAHTSHNDRERAPQINNPGIAPAAAASLCATALLLCAAFHPLMAVYALGFVLAVRLGRTRHPLLALSAFAAAILIGAAILKAIAHPEPPAAAAAAFSRYYWFLSQWQWYELLGLIGPLAVLAALTTSLRRHPRALNLIRAAIVLALIAIAATLLFAQEHFHAHAIARLQPLRVFLEIYALLPLLLGAWLVETCCSIQPAPHRRRKPARQIAFAALALVYAASFAAFFTAQRLTFPASPHIEWPGRAAVNPNPWVEAFLWVQHNTPTGALFALDAKYVNTPGEDTQYFRAIAQRSALPDFSKDGGEAAITPALAPAWQQGAAAQRDLSSLTDAERDQRLLPLGVTWVILHANAATAHLCPYRNPTVKVCRLN